MKNRGWKFRLLCLLLCACALAPAASAFSEGAERLPDRVLMSFYDRTLIVGDSQMRNLGNYMRKIRTDDPDFFPGVKCYGEYAGMTRTAIDKEKKKSREEQQRIKAEKERMEALEARIAVAERDAAVLENALADPETWKDAGSAAETTRKYNALKEEIEQLYEEYASIG